MTRSPKIKNLMRKIRNCIDSGNYIDTYHSILRQNERVITRPEILFVLKNGWHEQSKDSYKDVYQAWNYCIRGETIDCRRLRIVVSFDDNDLLIITAIDLDV